MMRPLGDRILVKRIENDKETASGILIPDTIQTTSMEGTILAVGPGAFDKKGNRNKMHVSEGQRVVFGMWSGEDITVEGEDYVMLTENDIIGVLKERD